MTQNPIRSAPVVRDGRRLVDDAVNDLRVRGHDNLRHALDAYANAILAEVRRRVEALETEGPDESPEGRPVMVPMPFGNYLDRTAVLAQLDGRDA